MADEYVQIKVGRDASNQLKYNHSSISRFHASIKVHKDVVMIEDNNSKNGTYINERKISKSDLKYGDKLRFGDYRVNVENLLDQLFDFHNRKRTDFKSEFEEIINHFEKYETRRKAMMKRPLTPLLVRAGLGVLVIGLIAVIDFNPTVRYALIFSVGILSMAGSYLVPSRYEKTEEMDLLRLEFESLLVCPKCRTKLTNRTLAYWKVKEQCDNPKCKAIYR